jgi:hypothetical protein
MKISKEVADICGCSVETVVKYAQKPENQINSIGSGQRKTYIWFEEDIERFKSQLRPAPGRPPKEPKPPA